VLATVGLAGTLAGCSDADGNADSDIPDPSVSDSEFPIDSPVDESKAFSEMQGGSPRL